MNAKTTLTGCLLLGLALTAGSQAQTIALQVAADSTLRQSPANQNRGSDPTLQLAGDGRVLLRFDQAAIAAAVGSGRLVSASLELFVHSTSGSWGPEGRPIEARRLTASWTETGVTWNCAIDSNPANNKPDCATRWDGGSFDEDATDSVVQTSAEHVRVPFDVTADVAAFLAGTPNQGWLIAKEDESQSGKADYGSREGVAAERPRLVLLVESAANDQVPPSLAITSPGQPILVNEPSPAVVVEYADGGSGIDLATFQVLVDGQDVSASCAAGAQSASCHAPNLIAGNHTVEARLKDHAGNAAQASAAFRLLLGPGPHLVTFQAVGDTDVRKGDANKNFGAEPILRVRQGSHNRALVQLDSQSLATTLVGATLVSASLELHIEKNGRNWGKTGRTVDAHRLTAAWTETGATWNCPHDSNTTNNKADCAAQWAGGSFAPAPTASVLHTRDLTGWVRFDVTADVTAFATGTPDFGWLLKKTEETRSGRVDYDSRQGTPGEAPRLVVVFTTADGTDTTPPTVAITAPAEGSLLATATPTITATWSDAGSGVDPASVRLVVDGVDRTAQAAVTAAGLSFTPGPPLADGFHTAKVTLADRAGNPAQASRGFTTDVTSPEVAVVAPTEPVIVGEPSPEIRVVYPDVSSGTDLASVTLTLDGADLTPYCTLDAAGAICKPAPLSGGAHEVRVTARDRVGNAAQDAVSFELQLDVTAPGITVSSPVDGAVVNTPTLEVAGTAVDDQGVTAVAVNGDPATLSGAAFHRTVSLAPGLNAFWVTARDAAGNEGTARTTVTLDAAAPELRVEAPPPGAQLNAASVRVEGTVHDDLEVVEVRVAGTPVAFTDNRFTAEVPLAEGASTIEVRAFDRAGNTAAVGVPVSRFTLPGLRITSPADLSFLASTTVAVSGTVSDPGATVTVNGVPATVSGTAFTALDVPLIEGGNLLTAVARNAAGREGTATVNVVRDLTPPRVTVEQPAAGSTLFTGTATVSGMINDIVAGTVNAPQAVVRVNGLPARVANRSYLVEGVPLAVGDNVLSVEAVDVSGNVGRASVTVRRAAAAVPRVVAVSGDGQEGEIGGLLPQPLVVALVDGAGVPVAGRPVAFAVRGNDGSLDGGKRLIAVTTDAQGQASTHFTLGTRAGVGNQVVEVSAGGFAGPAVFRATALPGPSALIVVDAGGQQVGVTGEPLPRPLVAVVTDRGHNRLAGVGVRFRVVRGRGQLAGGGTELAVTTDSDGRAIASLVLDVGEGIANNIVEAAIEGAPDGTPVASFVASGKAAGDPAQTSISGLVLDNQGQPIPGVALRVLDTSLHTQTSAQGIFRLAPAPVGTVRLVVDGSTANRPGAWPDLEYEVTTIPGRDNSVNMPIYLLPLDLQHGLTVDESHGGTLRLPEVPGFALEIAPGSVTFPGGSRSGVVSVTVVHNDKVPMVPNFGQQPVFIVTIQPAGARFEPPARLTLPNVESLTPGQVTEMYSFDHDLGHFVSIGPATVTDDGRLIVSNPGVGVIKAGWHCGGSSSSSATTHDCPECQKCSGNDCVADAAQNGNQCQNDVCKQCKNGGCVATETKPKIDAPPDNPTPPDSSFTTNFSFLSTTTIQARASLSGQGDPSKIEWQVTPTRGRIKNENPADRKGPQFSFDPDPPQHPAYSQGSGCGSPGNGSCARSQPLSYQIQAKYCPNTDRHTITQDQLDIIRQEYVNHAITVPSRGDFRFPVNTANFTAAEVRTTSYSVVLGSPELLAQAVYNAFNQMIVDDVQAQAVGTAHLVPTAPVVTPGPNIQVLNTAFLDTQPCDGALNPQTCDDQRLNNTIVAGPNGIAETRANRRVTAVRFSINSTWRNPERNEAVGGVLNSRHQYGNAVDMGLASGAEGRTQAQLYCILQTAADSVAGANGFAEHFGTQVSCTASNVTHIHVQQ